MSNGIVDRLRQQYELREITYPDGSESIAIVSEDVRREEAALEIERLNREILGWTLASQMGRDPETLRLKELIVKSQELIDILKAIVGN